MMQKTPAKVKTIDEQIRLLQKYGNPDFMGRCAIGLALLGVAYYKGEFFFIMLALMFAIIGLANRRLALHLIWAAKAWRVGHSASGSLDLSVKSDDDGATYIGMVRDAEHKTWLMQFCKPHGWEPQTGKEPAKLYYITEARWPVLIVAPQGILVPRSEPKLKN
jgi:hypothetical protein